MAPFKSNLLKAPTWSCSVSFNYPSLMFRVNGKDGDPQKV